ncbi:MAG: DUF4258 domain-containing protein [Bacteroidetes bacterium]|nr:DUF4258 domain-containing protein [Bacteroidota bacterium]
MKYKYYIVLFTLLLALAGCDTAPREQDHSRPAATDTILPATDTKGPGTDHQTLIDPGTRLIYTRHARCRMACRHITEADIREVLREGHVNEAKSKQESGRCPAYAIEDERNSDHVRLRIVLAKCETEVKVVTCIDRDDEFACDCK